MKKCLVVLLVLVVTTQAFCLSPVSKQEFYELLIKEPRTIKMFKNADAQIAADDIFYSEDIDAICALLTSRQMVEEDDQFLREFIRTSGVPKASSVFQRNIYVPISHFDSNGALVELFYRYGEQVNAGEIIMLRLNNSYTASNPLLFCLRFTRYDDF